MTDRPVQAFLNKKRPLELWMVLFALAGALVLGGFLPIVGLTAGAGIFIGVAALVIIEKKLADEKKSKAKEPEAKA